MELTVRPPARALNGQAAEPPDLRPDGSLDVHSVFRTLQGEGPFAGEPAVFVRLAGCQLQCPMCDTEYTEGRARLDVQGLAARIGAVGTEMGTAMMPGLIVLTGGEPLRQNVGPLCELFLGDGRRVQVETNGGLSMIDVPHDVYVVCSPKTEHVHASVRGRRGVHWKYVLSHDAVGEDGLPTSSLLMPRPPARPDPLAKHYGRVWVQPADAGDDETNKLNQEAAVRSCLRFGYRLCLQLHKIVGVP